MHRFKFGVKCKFLKSAFGRKVKEPRKFPKQTHNYVNEYFILNRHIIAFVGH